MSGTIRDTKEGVQEVSIKVEHSNIEATTDADGRYHLNVGPGAIFQISRGGYAEQRISVSGRRQINIMIAPKPSYIKKLLVDKVREIESFAHFLKAEKQAIQFDSSLL